jgi:hypothetical protein
MSTHGDVLIIDGKDKSSRQWLHAYSDGDVGTVWNDLLTLPEWLAYRARLDYDLRYPADSGRQYKEPSTVECGIGSGWWISHILDFGIGTFDRFISVNCGAWSCNIANLLASRRLLRWCPISEENAPYHKVGRSPDVRVSCFGGYYDLKQSERRKITRVEWLKVLRCELERHANEVREKTGGAVT